VAYPVSNCFAGSLSEDRRHPARGGPRRESSRLEHDNAAALEPRLAEESQRHTGGLAGPGRRLENGCIAVAQRIPQGGQDLLYGQARSVTHDPRIARNLPRPRDVVSKGWHELCESRAVRSLPSGAMG
jgi:hypothetical protein